MIVTRSWTKCNSDNKLVQPTLFLDVWDGGSRRFERFPNGHEVCWEVISRELNESGFVETLRELPSWETTGEIMWDEQIPLFSQSQNSFHVPGWKVSVAVRNPNPKPVPSNARRGRHPPGKNKPRHPNL
jgi:hypothetical protein